MARTSKELAKRLRYERRPRRDRVLRWYLPLGLGAVVAAAGLWWLLDVTRGEQQYAPGPVVAGHAAFGEACDTCHAPFRGVRDDACLACHPPGVHSPHQVASPACASCHVEHRGATLVAIDDASCVACHARLETTGQPAVQATLTRFADHPIFRPLRDGVRDETALRFNHQAHLTSTRIPERDRLACASCHVPADDGARMQPVVFEAHCQRCHPQEVQGPVGALAVPHEHPAGIRTALTAMLVGLALDDPDAIFGDRPSRIPGRRVRDPIDRAGSLREYRDRWRDRLEAVLYRPYEPPQAGATVQQANEGCYLCHLQGGSGELPDLPTIAPPEIPRRWLAAAVFSHQPHHGVACEHCHASSARSVATGDVNLPALAVCTECHTDGSTRSSGTACVLCHRYHDGATARDAADPGMG